MTITVQEIDSTHRYIVKLLRVEDKLYSAQIKKYSLTDKGRYSLCIPKVSLILGPAHLIQLGNDVEFHFIELFNYTDKLILRERLSVEHRGYTVSTTTLNIAVTRICKCIGAGKPISFDEAISDKSTGRSLGDPFDFPPIEVIPLASAMRSVSDAATHSIDAMIMAGRTVGKSAHLLGEAMDVGRIDTSVRGGREPLKELKVSPLAKSSMLDKFLGHKSFEGKIELTPEMVEAMKKFGAK